MGTNIPSTPADGNIKTVIVPTVADLEAPTVAEATSGAGFDISCYLVAGGFALAVDQATITDERECDTITRGAPGRKTPTLSITGIDNTNSAVTDNDLAEALTEGSTWVAIRRRGKSHETAFADGDVVTVTEFTVGVRSDVPAEANSVLRSVWATFVNGFEPEAVIDGTAPVPTITSVLPSAAAEGQLVTITGDHFAGTTTVVFGATPASDFEIVSGTKIVASLPAGSAGSAAVTVTNAAGASSAFAYTRGA